MEPADANERFLKRLLGVQPDLKAFIASMVRDRVAADDLFQEVCLALWQSFGSYEPARPFGAWARGVAAKKVLQSFEKSRRIPLAFSPKTIQAVLEAYDRAEPAGPVETDGLRDCIAKLPERSRQLLALRYEQSMKLGDIGRRVGSSLDAVHKLLCRIRENLEECLRQRVQGEPR
jgi:RNA polymerase sigma-70 factor, ECF subfamily